MRSVLQALVTQVGYQALRALRWWCEIMPSSVVRAVATGVGNLAVCIGPRREACIQRVMQHWPAPIDHRRAQRVVDDHYRNLVRTGFEMLRIRLLRQRERLCRTVRAQGLCALLAPAPRGRLIVTAHLGNFVYSGAVIALLGGDLAIVIKHVKNKALERFWVEQHEAVGIQIIYNRNSIRDILQVLRRGGTLGFVYDQHDSRGGVWVDFMGDTAAAFRALPALSLRTGLPVYPGHTFRRPDGRHQVHVGQPIDPPAGQPEHVERELAQRYSDEIASWVQQHPEQWLWLHRRWRKPPEDASFSERAQRLVDRDTSNR